MLSRTHEAVSRIYLASEPMDRGCLMYYPGEDLDRYGEQGWELWKALAVHLDYWNEIYAEYWGIDAKEKPDHLEDEVWKRAKHYDEIAPRLLRAVLALNLREFNPEAELDALAASDFDILRRAIAAFGESVLIRDRLDFDLAEDALERLRNANQRARKLVGHMLGRSPSERAASFLSRATRLYVLGLEPESLVMCRAALDAALQDRIEDEEMERLGIEKSGGDYSLKTRIYAAYRAGIFSLDQKRDADRLRIAANSAVHIAPAFLEAGVADGFEAITILAELLSALFEPMDT